MMQTIFVYLALAYFAFSLWAVSRAWHEYDLGERLWLRLRRMIGGRAETKLTHTITHSCLRHVRTREELLRQSTNCGRQVTSARQAYDLELRNCIHCGSTFTVGLLSKFNSPQNGSHPHD